MGFDVHGLNPRVNENSFEVYNKYKDMEFNDKWKVLDNNKELRDKYWEEEDEFQAANPGTYFRNNCWWWRPLWDYVCINCKSLTQDDHQNGHHNGGHEISEEKATLVGLALKAQLKEGVVKKYAEKFEERRKEVDKDDFSSHYPFHEDNVKEFAEFCLQSGGFSID